MKDKEYLSRITVENNEIVEKKITWEIPYNDTNLDDWLQGFLTCMIGITFNETQVLEGMKAFAEERLPEENFNDIDNKFE